MSKENHPLVDAFGCLCVIVIVACVIYLAGALGLVPPGP